MSSPRVVLGAVALALSTAALAGTRRLDVETYRDKVHGGWLGKNIGVLYGEPTEFGIQWPKPGEPHKITWRGKELTLENTADWFVKPNGAHDQDDCYIELITLEGFEKFGLALTQRQVAELWQLNRPAIWCANAAAFNNFHNFAIWPPLSGHPAFSGNTTDIDAQIEVDLMGLISPGMPNTCEKWARFQAGITNFGEGTYAAVFIAQCYSAAFFDDDIRSTLQTALKKVPAESLYASMVRDLLEWHAAKMDWRDARQAYAKKYPQAHGIHAVANSACVILGLLWGEKDHTRTLQISTLAGWDSDCNPSTAAGILGCVIGAKATPDKWKEPLKDSYRNTTVKFYKNPTPISELAARMAAVGEKAILAAGGKVVEEGGKSFYEIPIEEPAPPVVDKATPEEIKAIRKEVLTKAMATLRSPSVAAKVTEEPEQRVRQAVAETDEAMRQIQRVCQLDRTLMDDSVVASVSQLINSSWPNLAFRAAMILVERDDPRAMHVLSRIIGLEKAPERLLAIAAFGRYAKDETCAKVLLDAFEKESDKKGAAARACLKALRGAPAPILLKVADMADKMEPALRSALRGELNELRKGAAPEVAARFADLSVKQVFEKWSRDWTVVDLGPDMSPGIRAEYLAKANVLMTHPLDRANACYLTRTVELAAEKKHRLEFAVASHDAAGADWELRVLVNGKELLRKTIGPVDGKPAWQPITVDLTPYAGQKVTLRLENAPNGWSWEGGYWTVPTLASE